MPDLARRINAGPWCGAVMPDGATIKISVMRSVQAAVLVLSEHEDLHTPVRIPLSASWEDPDLKYAHRVLTFRVRDLSPGRQYFYAVELDGQLGAQSDDDGPTIGRFTTFPARGSRTSFTFGLGSCSSNKRLPFDPFLGPEAFTALANEADEAELLFFFHLGDFYYDIDNRKSVGKRLKKYDWVLSRPELQPFFRKLPVAYTWDDHDFLGNNAEGGDPENRNAREIALKAYDQYVPHYPFAVPGDGLYQAFEVGRVLFLLTDARFNRSPRVGSDGSGRTMLGTNQKAWLKRYFAQASEWDLIVWANSVPWVGQPNGNSDFWAGYASERQELADVIKQNGVRNLCMISGDAHMLAIDDGSGSGYATGGGGGFPVFHAASLESVPSEKGGPYAIGAPGGGPGPGIAGKRQYGTFAVTYSPSGTLAVEWKGKRARKGIDNSPIGASVSDIVIEHTFSV